MQEWRKMALLMEIRLQKNEKRNISSDYHVQYAANHLEKAKDVFMKAMKILWIYIIFFRNYPLNFCKLLNKIMGFVFHKLPI